MLYRPSSILDKIVSKNKNRKELILHEEYQILQNKVELDSFDLDVEIRGKRIRHARFNKIDYLETVIELDSELTIYLGEKHLNLNFKNGNIVTSFNQAISRFMKSKYLIFFILTFLFIHSSCMNDDEVSNDSKSGLLKKVEEVVNEDLIDNTTEIFYDNSQRIISIEFSQGNFYSAIYNIDYNNDVISTLRVTQEFQNSGTESVETYNINYINDQIILTSLTLEEKYILGVNNGYVSTFKNYLDIENDYFYEALFKRDAQNNIDTISYFATNELDTNLLIWQYTFSDFESETNVNSAFNPVFNYSFSFYDRFIGLALGLEISNDLPLKSSFLDGGGNYLEENISAEITEINNDLPLKFQYTIHDLPENNYHLNFEYY